MSEGERVSKRKRTRSNSPATARESPLTMAPEMPDSITDVCADGDMVIVVDGLGGTQQPIGIRVSSHALSINSSVFKHIFSKTPPQPSHTATVVPLPDDDPNILYILFNVLHLRNDGLPAKLPLESLARYVALCQKYTCLPAASRAASPWLDYLNNKAPDPPLLDLIHIAYRLDDAVWFARFTARWVSHKPLGYPAGAEAIHPALPPTPPDDKLLQSLGTELRAKQTDGLNALKTDLDLLLEPLARALSSETLHNIGESPNADEDTPQPDDPPPAPCTVDKDCAVACLEALSSAGLWPANRWSHTLAEIVAKLERFESPEHDMGVHCQYCERVDRAFLQRLVLVRTLHDRRFWGVCLDCWRKGGLNEGECRYEHPKMLPLPMKQLAGTGPVVASTETEGLAVRT